MVVNGIEFVVKKSIDSNWNNYDKSVAQSQLFNYGKIYVDSFGCPIDDEFILEEINNNLK